MYMKKQVVILLLLCLAKISSGQQMPHWSQYMLNDYAMNPAIAGKNPYFLGISNNRYQWSGITDAPRTYVLTVHGPLKKMNMGVGSQLFVDITGPTRRIGFYGSYAYHAKLTDKIKLGLGLNAGVLQFVMDGQKITLHDQGDYVLQNALQSALMPDFGAGFYLYSDNFWVGASAMQIFESRIKFFDYLATTGVINRHYYGMAGYRFHLGDDFILEPSVLTKYVKPAPFQFDGGMRAIYKEKIWLGASYRNLDAWDMYTGFIYRENLMIGYSYDFTTTNLKNYSSGTHELLIGIRFNNKGNSSSAQTQFN